MSELSENHEKLLIQRLAGDDQLAFTEIFKRYYQDLVRFSLGITQHTDASEEIVQDVFLKLWENRATQVIHNSLKSFLLKSVQNRSIDYLRHSTITSRYALTVLGHPALFENDTENYILFSELQDKLNSALDRIPAQYAEAFRMSRMERLNYEEIASKQNVSVRIVEVHIAKALNLLRIELRDYLPVFLILFGIYRN